MSSAIIKMMMMAAMAFAFASAPVYAEKAAASDDEEEEAPKKSKKAAKVAEDDEEEEAPKKSRKKSKKNKKVQIGAERMFVAINKFDNKSGAEAQQYETIRSRVQQCVVGSRKFEVVEREQLQTAKKEAEMAASGQTDSEDADAPEEGKLKAASYVIYGNILYCGADQAKGGAEGIASAVTKYKVELQIKITDGETGKILTVKSAIGYGIDRATATEGFQSSSAQGMRDAIDEACHMAADALRDVAYPAKIVRVGKKNVTLNLSDEEVKEDDVFEVVEADEPLTDPDTGSFLGYDGDEVGRIRISSTSAKLSKAEPAEENGVDLDDLDMDEHNYIVRRVSKATLQKEAKKKSKKKKQAFENRF